MGLCDADGGHGAGDGEVPVIGGQTLAGAVKKGRRSIWLLWLVLALTGPVTGMWAAAIASMIGTAAIPPLGWIVCVTAWLVVAASLLVWSRRQSLADPNLPSWRWPTHFLGLMVAFAIARLGRFCISIQGTTHG
jgi:hypothetical protein